MKIKLTKIFGILFCIFILSFVVFGEEKAQKNLKVTNKSFSLKGKPGETFTNKFGMTFVYIPPGTFMMGSPKGELGRDEDERQHRVTISKGFYMGETELLEGLWSYSLLNVKTGPRSHYNPKSKYPLRNISWEECKEYIKILNDLDKDIKYRLPTEAEWEYACRAGSTTAYSNGDNVELSCGPDKNLEVIGWYCGNSNNSRKHVKQKQPNAWGLYDMHGNIWEWCEDWYGEYPNHSVVDPKGHSSGTRRVIRGGSFGTTARGCRSADRVSGASDVKRPYLGLRLVAEPKR